MLVTPSDRPMVHHCGQSVGIEEDPASRVRYVGLREHVRRVWAATWVNRPRLERNKPHAVRAHSSEEVLEPYLKRFRTIRDVSD